MNKRAIILANGLFPKRQEALQALLQASLLICCDGAYNKLVASKLFSHANVHPEVHVVGDGDSLSYDIRKNPPFPTTFVDGYSDQETNDLTKAVRYALSLDISRIVILGSTGLREDHTLGNISLLAYYSTLSTTSGTPLTIRLYTDYGFFTPLRASAKLPSFPRQQVSLFPFNPQMVLTVEGLKYPIVRQQFSYWWETTLNEAIANEFSIDIEGSGILLVYQTHHPKSPRD